MRARDGPEYPKTLCVSFMDVPKCEHAACAVPSATKARESSFVEVVLEFVEHQNQDVVIDRDQVGFEFELNKCLLYLKPGQGKLQSIPSGLGPEIELF